MKVWRISSIQLIEKDLSREFVWAEKRCLLMQEHLRPLWIIIWVSRDCKEESMRDDHAGPSRLVEKESLLVSEWQVKHSLILTGQLETIEWIVNEQLQVTRWCVWSISSEKWDCGTRLSPLFYVEWESFSSLIHSWKSIQAVGYSLLQRGLVSEGKRSKIKVGGGVIDAVWWRRE